VRPALSSLRPNYSLKASKWEDGRWRHSNSAGETH